MRVGRDKRVNGALETVEGVALAFHFKVPCRNHFRKLHVFAMFSKKTRQAAYSVVP